MNENDYQKIDLSQYTNKWWNPGRGILRIGLWRGLGMPLFRLIPNEPFATALWNRLKCGLLRLFGARIGKGVVIRSSCEIYYPWNLEIGDYAWIGYGSNLYTLMKIRIGSHACVSQNVFMCTGSHDMTDPYMGLIVGEITVGDGAWVCAGSFLHPGVTVGNGAVVGACSVVTKDIPQMMLAAGNPCKVIRERELRDLQPGDGGGLKRGPELIAPADLQKRKE